MTAAKHHIQPATYAFVHPTSNDFPLETMCVDFRFIRLVYCAFSDELILGTKPTSSVWNSGNFFNCCKLQHLLLLWSCGMLCSGSKYQGAVHMRHKSHVALLLCLWSLNQCFDDTCNLLVILSLFSDTAKIMLLGLHSIISLSSTYACM